MEFLTIFLASGPTYPTAWFSDIIDAIVMIGKFNRKPSAKPLSVLRLGGKFPLGRGGTPEELEPASPRL